MVEVLDLLGVEVDEAVACAVGPHETVAVRVYARFHGADLLRWYGTTKIYKG